MDAHRDFIYREGSRIYLSILFPLTSTATLIAVATNLILSFGPSHPFLAIGWNILLNFFSTVMLVSIVTVAILQESHRNGRSGLAAGIVGLRYFGVRALAGTGILLAITGILLLTWIGTILASFFIVRSLFFPIAVVLEDTDAIDSITRSWELTNKRFWQTACIVLIGSCPYLLVMLALTIGNTPRIWSFFIIVGIQGLVAPFVAIILILTFKAYRLSVDGTGGNDTSL